MNEKPMSAHLIDEVLHPNAYVEYSSETGQYTVYERQHFTVIAVYENVYSPVRVILGVRKVK